VANQLLVASQVLVANQALVARNGAQSDPARVHAEVVLSDLEKAAA
jgi:hypothetical protein